MPVMENLSQIETPVAGRLQAGVQEGVQGRSMLAEPLQPMTASRRPSL